VLTASSNVNGQGPSYTHPSFANGTTPSSYQLADFDRVNLFNRKVDFMFSIVSLPGRGKLSASIDLPADSYWTQTNVDGSYSYRYENDSEWNRSYGWYRPGIVSLITIHDPPSGFICDGSTAIPQKSVARILVRLGDGTEMNFHSVANNGKPYFNSNVCFHNDPYNRGRVFVSENSEAATFVTDADVFDHPFNGGSVDGTLITRDGTRYRFEGGVLVWVRDTNGNYITYTWASNPRVGFAVTSIRDSIGHQITINYTDQIGQYDTITYKGFGGAERQIKVWYTNMGAVMRQGSSLKTLDELFANSDSGNPTYFNPIVVSKIEYPGVSGANTTYFYYNSYGELSRVILPTGGGYDYHFREEGLPTYRGFTSSVNLFRPLQKRVVFKTLTNTADPDNPPPDNVIRQEFYSMSFQSGVRTRVITFEARDGNNVPVSFSKHYFYDVRDVFCYPASNSDWEQGLEWKIEEYQVNNGVIGSRLKTIQHTYSPTPPASEDGRCSEDPHPNSKIIETKTTWNDVNLVSKQVYGHDSFHNRTEVYEYGFGVGAPGPLLRHTHTDYLTNNPYQNNVNYAADLNIHIRNLPTMVSIYDGNNTEVSRTYFDYDRYDAFSLQDCPNIVQHDGGYNTGYGRRGNQTLVTKLVTLNPASPIYLHRQYDIAGNVVRTVDPRGNPTTFDYNDRYGRPSGEARSNTPPMELGSQLSYAFPTKVTNALGHETYTKYDYYLGKPVDTEDQNEVATSFSYNDPLDRRTQVIYVSDIASLKNQTTYLYNDVARTITTTSDRDRFDDNILTSIVYYDGLGRTWRSASDEGAAWTITDTGFDALDRVSQASNPYRAADPDSAVAPAGIWTKTSYDSLGRVVDVESPDGAHMTTLYSGNQVTVIDQAGKRRRNETDVLGRLIRVTEDPGRLNYVTNYSYDANDNLLQVTQGSQIRTFAYDSLFRLTSATNPENGTITYAYDQNGNLTEKTDARGVKTTMTYDALNRVISKTYSGTTDEGRAAANATQPVSYFYDGYSSLPSGAPSWPGTPSKGRLVGVTYGTGSEGTYHQYDARGRIVTNHQRMGTANYVTKYTYNLADGVLTERRGSPTAEFLRNSSTYDAAGRLTRMMSSFTPFLTESILVSDITYTPFGALQSETYGNDLIHSIGYNNRHQPTEIRLGRLGNLESVFTIYNLYGVAQNPNVADPEITLLGQNNGNIARIKYSVSGTIQYTQTFLYDPLDRLQYAVEHNHGNRTDAARAWYQTCEYDRFGNRGIDTANTSDNLDGTNTALQLADFSAANNRIIRSDYTYDSAGNLIAEPDQSYTYDGEGRLVRAVVGGVVSQYVYDGNGRRVKKMIGGVGTTFEYGKDGELIGERNASTGALTKGYFYRNGQLLATTEDGTTHKFATADHLGTPRAWTDRFGNVIQGGLHDYAPFGQELFAGYGVRTTAQGYAANTQADGQRKQFTSKERDSETGLDYFLARYYSSTHGRFLSPDEFTGGPDELYDFADAASANPTFYADLIDPQSLNKYQYCYNNPLTTVDPDGHKGWKEWARQAVSTAVDFGDGVIRGAAASLSVGTAPGSGPSVNDSWVNIAGQVVGTAIVGGTGGNLISGGTVISGTGVGAIVGVPAIAAGTTMVVGAATNGLAIITTSARKSNNSQQSSGNDNNNNTDKRFDKATGQSSSGHPTDQHGNKLGPSGKPMIHQINHSSRKKARDAARNAGDGRPMQHPSPRRGEPHFHATKKNKKVKDGTHHNYPEE
jgi:RHS repeat-associated protein